MSKVVVPDTVKRLVETSDDHADWCKSPDYREARLREEFLNPFFEALGWDVYNKLGFAPRSQQVIHEDTLRMGGTTKAPDYSFRIGGRRYFFVEAKAPSLDLDKDPSPAFRLRRHAWTAKLPLSILTDFEEFSVYDTRTRPAEKDKAGIARLRLIPFREYEDAWEEPVDTFSPDAILQGALDKYAESGWKRGTTPVDAEFLKTDFPRVPLTSDVKLFRKLCALGAELVASHLMESPTLDTLVTRYPKKGSDLVEEVWFSVAEGGKRSAEAGSCTSTTTSTSRAPGPRSGSSISAATRCSTSGSRTARRRSGSSRPTTFATASASSSPSATPAPDVRNRQGHPRLAD